ncbi:promiscuous aldo/keto reductase [Carnobacterium maltaromaticum]|uniref:aldo/keto reductase n=1 Tax=Carnobacterium maltaromaticum TaxID=2751 RepID=UPI00191BA2F1|nr:aldo/keto reductase [Carnobacterium maltaromaticum]CAD5897417.1 promiscuous aldo/keto reductase [Carnobacterium maltaromaticum]
MNINFENQVTLNNEVNMPWIGLGVFRVEDHAELVEAIKLAIVQGYRSIDTASIYGNEEAVGEGIRQGIVAAGISRKELFVTSKVWTADMGFEEVEKAYQVSLDKLGLDYLDLYLIHWPVAGKFIPTWKKMEELYQDGKIRSIGVSNFQIHHLEELFAETSIKPVINQVEYHPKLTQLELQNYLKQHNIQMEAWSPLMNGEILMNPVVLAIAERHGKTAAQVILRWDLQNGVITIPKSTNEQRLAQNKDIVDFNLSEQDMHQIQQLNENHRIGPDPDNFDF